MDAQFLRGIEACLVMGHLNRSVAGWRLAVALGESSMVRWSSDPKQKTEAWNPGEATDRSCSVSPGGVVSCRGPSRGRQGAYQGREGKLCCPLVLDGGTLGGWALASQGGNCRVTGSLGESGQLPGGGPGGGAPGSGLGSEELRKATGVGG